MTKSEFTSLVNANGGPGCVLNVILDNSMIVRYLDDDHILNLNEDVVTIGGVDYIKNYTLISDNRPDKRPNVVHPIVTYHPMEIIQGVQFIKSNDERKYLARKNMFDL